MSYSSFKEMESWNRSYVTLESSRENVWTRSPTPPIDYTMKWMPRRPLWLPAIANGGHRYSRDELSRHNIRQPQDSSSAWQKKPAENVVQNGQTRGPLQSVPLTSMTVDGQDVVRRARVSTKGSTVSSHGLNYVVDAPVPGRRCCCTKGPKEILHDISGVFRPGMNAIMGPTGSGKTTLLDLLAGRTERKGISGHILIDGQKQPKNFKCMTGYVVQDDVVMGTLTVRENLMFSANVRLPAAISYRQKCRRVVETINELGLGKCADSKVGTEFIRGVSGGERKRTNIGMELIISPGILFLDEPTTGLDASTANAVMSILHRLSHRGCTIIFSIHQPRYTIFKLFDRLSLLGSGHTVFHGPSAEALTFFNSIGYVCEEYNNPPDFFLDVINGDSTAVRSVDGPASGDYVNQLYQMAYGRQNKTLAEDLSAKYYNSVWSHRTSEELKPIFLEYLERPGMSDKDVQRGQYATSFATQLKHLSKRSLLNLFRNPETSVLQIMFMALVGLLVGVVYLQLELSQSGLQSRQGLLFFVAAHNVLISIPAVELFIRERVIFVHESASGFYRVSAYFFSKIFCDLVPLRVIPLIPLSVIIYFMAGLQVDVGKFFIYFLDLFLTTMSATTIAFVASASVGSLPIANLIVIVIFIIMLLFGGLLVNVDSLGDWISWLQYLSILRYSLNTLMINEMHDLNFTLDKTNVTIPGDVFLKERQSVTYASAWDLWQNIMALGIFAVGLMFLAYVQLRRMKKLK